MGQEEQAVIDMVPQNSLHDVRISVSTEWSEHYNKILQRRDEILDDPDAEDKTVVSILSATTSAIKELAKIQQELYSSERFAVLQQVIVDVLKEVDPELMQRVLEAFEERQKAL